MKNTLLRLLSLLLTLLFLLAGTALAEEILVDGDIALTEKYCVEYGSAYSTPEEVALYLHVFEELPVNYITKKDASALGWVSSKGNLWKVTDRMSIGGDRFGNREKLLPTAKGRQWYECDVNYYGGYRGSDRLVFSSDGIICFSSDHYNSYEVLYENWYYEDGYYPHEY